MAYPTLIAMASRVYAVDDIAGNETLTLRWICLVVFLQKSRLRGSPELTAILDFPAAQPRHSPSLADIPSTYVVSSE
jgi:hypothetical protein